jgi:hypothetical protein
MWVGTPVSLEFGTEISGRLKGYKIGTLFEGEEFSLDADPSVFRDHEDIKGGFCKTNYLV